MGDNYFYSVKTGALGAKRSAIVRSGCCRWRPFEPDRVMVVSTMSAESATEQRGCARPVLGGVCDQTDSPGFASLTGLFGPSGRTGLAKPISRRTAHRTTQGGTQQPPDLAVSRHCREPISRMRSGNRNRRQKVRRASRPGRARPLRSASRRICSSSLPRELSCARALRCLCRQPFSYAQTVAEQKS